MVWEGEEVAAEEEAGRLEVLREHWDLMRLRQLPQLSSMCQMNLLPKFRLQNKSGRVNGLECASLWALVNSVQSHIRLQSKEELFAIFPELGTSVNGIASEIFETPIILLEGTNGMSVSNVSSTDNVAMDITMSAHCHLPQHSEIEFVLQCSGLHS